MTENSRFLALDCGNSRIKTILLDGEETNVRTYDYGSIEGLIDWISESGAGKVAMASVHGFDPRLVETIRKAAGENFLLMTPATEMPVAFEYDDPTHLGIDRKIAAVGAMTLYPGEPVLVVDAGTALTKDVVDGYRGFIGGSISPGLRMRLSALHSATALLPEIGMTDCGQLPVLGRSTRDSIMAGAMQGMLDEVEMMMIRLRTKGVGRVIFCGGDGEWIYNNLRTARSGAGMKFNYEPYLLAYGMQEIYRHHEEKN